MKSSSRPATKSAGMKHPGACWTAASAVILNPARCCTEARMARSASRVTKRGTCTPCSRPLSTISSASTPRSENGESSTMAAMPGSRSACMMAVTAPMLRPQSATADTRPVPRRAATRALRSSFSKNPSETYSPSESPEPAKSSAASVTPRERQRLSWGRASRRAEEFPCRYTRQGSCPPSSLDGYSRGSQCEHRSVCPRSLVTCVCVWSVM